MTKHTNNLREILANWEHEVTGDPKHWARTAEREAIDSKYLVKIEALISDKVVEARIDELHTAWEFLKKAGVFDQDAAMKLSYPFKNRLAELKEGKS